MMVFHSKKCTTSFLQLLIDAGWAVMPAKVRNGWPEVDTARLSHERLAFQGDLNEWTANS